jgi:tetratricopeptide (TPR) repeat protein
MEQLVQNTDKNNSDPLGLEEHIEKVESVLLSLEERKTGAELICFIQENFDKLKDALRQLNLAGDTERVSEMCLDLVESNLADAEVYSILGCAFQNLEKYELSAKAFTAGLLIEPNNAQILSNLAVCYGSMELYTDAIERIDSAIEIEAGNISFLSNKATLLHMCGQNNDSMDLWEDILKRDPTNQIALDAKNFLTSVVTDVEYAETGHSD